MTKDPLSPASLLVLGCTFLMVSPALWDALSGELDLRVAMTRYLVVLVGCWFALSIAHSLTPSTTPPDRTLDTHSAVDTNSAVDTRMGADPRTAVDTPDPAEPAT